MSDQAFDPRRFGKTARNEQRKLVATSFNTVGLAVLGIGFLTPALTGEPLSRAPFKIVLVFAILLTAHIIAQRILATMEE